MQFQDSVESEYRDIVRTMFWKDFVMHIMSAREQEVRDLCNSAKGDDVLKKQGRIFAYNLVMGLPNKIVESSKGKTDEAPDGV